MYNRINRFVRNIESKYDCDEDNLIIETAVYVPERVASQTNIPWKTIFRHISGFIAEDQVGVREITQFSVANNSNGTQTVTLGFRDAENIPQISSVQLSVPDAISLAFGNDTSLTSNSSASALISAGLSYKYGGKDKSVSAERYITNLVRSVSISGISLGGDKSNVSATIALNVNGLSTDPVNSNSHQMAGIGITEISGLSITEKSDGSIQNITLGYFTTDSIDHELSSLSTVSADLSVMKLTGISTELNISSDILSTYIGYKGFDGSDKKLSSTVDLSAYKSVTEEDPIFWQSEHDIPVAISANNLTRSPFINEISTAQYHEQSYVKGSELSGTYNLMMPTAQSDKVGAFTLYMEENPTDDPDTSFVYNLSTANIKTLPTRKPWLSAGGDGVWKFEFVSIPGSDKWQYIQSTKFKTT